MDLTAHTSTSEKNILLVEDDPFWQRVISDNLGKASHNCHISLAVSADEAVTKIRSEHYNLIVSDYYLEGDKTGYQLWRDCVNGGIDVPFLLTSGQLDFPDYAVRNLPVTFLPKSLIGSKLRHRAAQMLNSVEPQKFLNERRLSELFGLKYQFEFYCLILAVASTMIATQPSFYLEPKVEPLPSILTAPPREDLIPLPTPAPPAFRYDREKIFTPDLIAQLELILQRADEILAMQDQSEASVSK